MDDPAYPPSGPSPTPVPTKENFINPPPGPGLIPENERQMAMFLHLSALSVFVTGIGFILGPVILWQLKKAEMPSLDEVGKEAVNFQISWFIWQLISGALICIAIGVVTSPILFIAWLAFTVIAGLKANEGVFYRYPLTIRFIK